MVDQADEQRARQQGRGRQARAPHCIPLKGWKDIAWRLWHDLNENHVMLTAAGVTFYILLALVPALNCFIAVYGLFNSPDTAAQQVQLLSGIVPSGGLHLIEDQLVRLATQEDRSLSFALLASLGIALWSAAAGFRALFEAMNVAYHETEKRGFIRVNLLTLAATLASAIAATIVLSAVLLIPVILGFIPVGGDLGWLVRLLGYLAMLAVYVTGIAALYRWGPSRHGARWRWIGQGNVLAVVGTVIVSLLFSWYVGSFGNYGSTYGSLGALIAFLTWIWISVSIVILGASLNAQIEHQTARDTTVGGDQELGERGAVVADTVGESLQAAPALKSGDEGKDPENQ